MPRMFPLLLLLLCFSSAASAQNILRLSNSTQDDIVMKYLPRNQRPNPMKEAVIKAGKSLDITLQGDDPFDVSFQLTSENGQPNFQAKVGTLDGVPLRDLAKSQQRFDVALTLAAKEQGRRVLGQVMSAKLIDPNGNVTAAISSPNNASEFVDNVISDPWNTNYIIADGTTVKATVDFSNLTFRTTSFKAVFEDLAIFEDADGCQIVGRWAVGNTKGNVYFSISRDKPNEVRGEYTFDGNATRRKWSGSQR